MIKARAGDIILVSCGTYREANIQVKPGVSLWSGTLQPDCVTIDAGGQGRCLLFSGADSTTSVVGFTLRGGVAHGPGEAGQGGAVMVQDSSPRLTRCLFMANSAIRGGALAVVGNSAPELGTCRFEDNQADDSGGAVYWTAATGVLADCTLRGNTATVSGGGLACNAGQILISGCLIQDNVAGNIGGAIFLNASQATVARTIFAHNVGGLAGGALAGANSAALMNQCTLDGNTADGQATVLWLDRTSPRLERCLITGSAGDLMEATGGLPELRSCNIFVPAEDGWPGSLRKQQNRDGNHAVDPLYCQPATGDYHLQAESPCLANDQTLSIGALGEGCGAQFPAGMVE